MEAAAVHPVLQELRLQEAGHLLQQGLILGMDLRLGKGPAPGVRVHGREIGVRVIDRVVELLVKVHLHHGGVGIVQQGLVLVAQQLQGVDLPGALRRGQLQIPGNNVLRAADQLRELAPHVLEALQEPGGEGPALPGQDHVHRLLIGVGGLIGAVRGQGVKGIRKAHHLGAEGDLVPPEPLGVAPAVPALVVVAADMVGVAEVVLVRRAAEVFQHPAAAEGMGLHDLELLRSQGLVFIQDGVRNGNLSDVVEGRGAGDAADLPLGEPVLRAAAGHILQQDLGQAAQPQHVAAGLRAAELDDGGEGVHHRLVGVAQVLGLILHQLFQMVLVPAELRRVAHPLAHQGRQEGRRQHIAGAQTQGPFRRLGTAVRQQEEEGDLPLPQHLGQGVLPGQAERQHHRSQAIPVLLHQEPCLAAVLRLQQVIAVLQDLPQGSAGSGVLCRQQQGISGSHTASLPSQA